MIKDDLNTFKLQDELHKLQLHMKKNTYIQQTHHFTFIEKKIENQTRN